MTPLSSASPEIATKFSRNRDGWLAFSGLEVLPDEGLLRHEGREHRLRPKSTQVLLYIAANADRVVSKEELFEKLWGSAAVTEDSLVQCVAEIRKALGDNPKTPRYIRTIPKLGYRFQEATPVQPRNRLRWWGGLTAGAALVVLLFLSRMTGISDVSRPAAVMSFENRSGANDLDWLREGLADMVATGLSRKVAVTSRQELASQLKRAGKNAADVSFESSLEAARKANAGSLVVGSFGRIGNKVRIDVHLHETAKGTVIAAEQLIADNPEQILSHIDVLSMKLSARLSKAKQQPAESSLVEATTQNLEAYREYSLGLEKAHALDLKVALAHFEKAVQADPEFAMAHARIGYVHSVVGTNALAGQPHLEKAFRSSTRLAPKERLYVAAWYAISKLDYEGAIRSLQALVNQYPFEVEAHWRLGQLLRGEDRPREAADILQRAMVIDPESKELANTLGGIYSELGRHEEAISARKKYVALAPSDPNSHDSLGLTYQWAGDYAHAEESYRAALALDPNFPFAVAHYGDLDYRLGRYRAALERYERYVQIAATALERARGYGSMVVIHLKRGDRAAAARASAEERSATSEFAMGSALLSLESGDLPAARSFRESLFRTARNSPRGARQHQRMMLYLDGLIALREGRQEDALRTFEKALKARPVVWNIESYEDCLAAAQFSLGRFTDAAREYERILRLNPNDANARYRLGLSLLRQGREDKAVEQFTRFLSIWNTADNGLAEVAAARKLAKL